jgi:putative FmdB family regulatory protein
VPTYVYACRSCEEQLEVVQKMSDAPLKDCPRCEGGSLRRVLFPPAVVYKGSGFYTTDYKNGGGKSGGGSRSESSESGSESKTEAKSESKTETKSETKPDTKSETPAAS